MANDIYIIEKIKFVSYQKHILGYKQYLIVNKSLLILMVGTIPISLLFRRFSVIFCYSAYWAVLVWVMACLFVTNDHLQYIPRNMHTVFALLCFVVIIHWLIFPYPSSLLHWHCGNLTIAPVPAKQRWWIWIDASCEFIMNDCITTTKQSTTKPCAYFLGYTVPHWRLNPLYLIIEARDSYRCQYTRPPLVQLMAWPLFDTNQFLLAYCYWSSGNLGEISIKW